MAEQLETTEMNSPLRKECASLKTKLSQQQEGDKEQHLIALIKKRKLMSWFVLMLELSFSIFGVVALFAVAMKDFSPQEICLVGIFLFCLELYQTMKKKRVIGKVPWQILTEHH